MNYSWYAFEFFGYGTYNIPAFFNFSHLIDKESRLDSYQSNLIIKKSDDASDSPVLLSPKYACLV